MIWRRDTTGGNNPQPADPTIDLHPAQLELVDAQQRIQACRDELRATVLRVGNSRPATRDALLDAALALGIGAR